MYNERKTLTLKERIQVIERNEKDEPVRTIALSLGVGKTQIQNIIRDKVNTKYMRCSFQIMYIAY